MAYGCTITVQAGQMPSTQSGFVWLFTQDNLPTAAIDGGANSIDNGGGNLRCYTDSSKATQLPIEEVQFVTGGTPQAQVWGRSASLGVGGTVYIEADDTATAQPPATDTYGRNSVWVGYDIQCHFNDSLDDSTGNYTTNLFGSVFYVNGNIGRSAVFGVGDGFNYTGVNSASTSYKLSFWGDISNKTSNYATIIRNSESQIARYSTGNRILVRHSGSATQLPSWWDYLISGVNHKYDFVWSSSDGVLRIYRDGAQMDSQAITNVMNLALFNTIFYENSSIGLGLSSSGFGIAVDGTYSADSITSEYNNQNSPTSFWSSSAWEDQGGGGDTVTSNINLSINKPVFSVQVSKVTPSVNASLSFEVGEPVFSVQADNSIPGSGATVALNIASPVFSVQASKTAPGNNATADFQITAPIFTVSADSSVPQFNTNVSFEINAPQFSIAATNTQPSEGASVSIVVPAPQFSVQASRTILDTTANADITINGPIFTIYAGTDSDSFHYADGAITYISTESKTVSLPSQSRVVTIKSIK